MRRLARQPFGSLSANGSRIEERRALAFSATLHVDGAAARLVEVADLTAGGCRVTAPSDLAVATYVSLMLKGATLISGRIAWNDGEGMGIDFCTQLLPKIVARLSSDASPADDMPPGDATASIARSRLRAASAARMSRRRNHGTIIMNEVRADVDTAFEDPTGVFFHVETPGRRMKVHAPFATLAELGSGEGSGDFAKFVRENEPIMQRLVDEGIGNGWKGPLALIV